MAAIVMCPADKMGAWLPFPPLTTAGAYGVLSIAGLVSELESEESGARVEGPIRWWVGTGMGKTGGDMVVSESGGVVRGLEVGGSAMLHALLWVVREI